jgi:hypothetical protein
LKHDVHGPGLFLLIPIVDLLIFPLPADLLRAFIN